MEFSEIKFAKEFVEFGVFDFFWPRGTFCGFRINCGSSSDFCWYLVPFLLGQHLLNSATRVSLGFASFCLLDCRLFVTFLWLDLLILCLDSSLGLNLIYFGFLAFMWSTLFQMSSFLYSDVDDGGYESLASDDTSELGASAVNREMEGMFAMKHSQISLILGGKHDERGRSPATHDSRLGGGQQNGSG